MITTRGKMVFVAESFPLPLARKLTALILDAQGGGGAMRMTSVPVLPTTPLLPQGAPHLDFATSDSTVAPSYPGLLAKKLHDLADHSRVAPSSSGFSQEESYSSEIGSPLSGDLVQFFGECGVMKSAIDAMVRPESAHSSLLH